MSPGIVPTSTFRIKGLPGVNCQFGELGVVWWKDANIFLMDGGTKLSLLLFNVPSNAKKLDFVIFIGDKMIDLLISLCCRWGS